jgi:hypothetical protein
LIKLIDRSPLQLSSLAILPGFRGFMGLFAPAKSRWHCGDRQPQRFEPVFFDRAFMSEQSQSGASRQEVFILLRPDPTSVTAAIDRVTSAIEASGGRMVMSYPPAALVAELPHGKAPELAGQADIEAIRGDAFSDEQVNNELSDLRFVMIAWNNRCTARSGGGTAASSRGLSWDAPGMLPPDPPAHVREALRQREKEMMSDGSDA